MMNLCRRGIGEMRSEQTDSCMRSVAFVPQTEHGAGACDSVGAETSGMPVGDRPGVAA
jgi:hypothetical protein